MDWYEIVCVCAIVGLEACPAHQKTEHLPVEAEGPMHLVFDGQNRDGDLEIVGYSGPGVTGHPTLLILNGQGEVEEI
jgi:hypothetical protein